ncbi:MAG: tetratricopeptide repeat protein [Candidatus Krumholzibacteria bacterium]|nr:tetratricopeptide repeat protein [Candidatus Krumholzibacteria bacterium]
MEERKFSIEPYLVRLDEALVSNKKWLVALALGAFVLKVIYVLESADSLELHVPIMDAKYYDNTARDILSGNVLRREAFFMGPLYSYFLAVVYGVFGRDFTVVRLIQAAGGTATIVLTYLLGCRAFRPVIGLLSAILLALYGAFAFYETQILMMWMGALLNTAMLLLLLRIKPQSRPFSYLAPGFLLGLSALARANILVFWPIAIVWILVVQMATSRWAKAAAFTAATVIAILPVTIHNYIASRDLVPVTSNAGINFYIGNSEVATGIFYPPPGTDFVTDATTRTYVERLTGRDMTPSEVSAYWFDKAFSFIRSHPAAELKLLGRKAAMFFNAYEMPQIESYDLTRRRYSSLRLFPIHFWFLGAVGIFGLLFSLSRWRKHFLLYGFVLSYALSIVCFFVTARYRIQIAPVMALFTGYALLGAVPRVNDVRRGVGTLGLLLLIFFLTQPRLFAMDPDEVDFREHIHEARRASVVGEYERAVEQIDLAIELFPDYYEGYLHRAIIHKEGEQLFKAIEDYSRALRKRPDLSSVHYDLAQTFRRVRLKRQAIDEYKKAIELDPVMIKAYNNLGITYSELGQYQQAVENFERVIEMDPSYLKAYNNLGAALAESGRVDQAIDVLRKAVERDPNYARSYRNLANAYISNRLIQSAIEALTAYVRLVPGDDKARADLDKLYIAARGDSSAASPENGDESGE